jgi:hypothetical protein
MAEADRIQERSSLAAARLRIGRVVGCTHPRAMAPFAISDPDAGPSGAMAVGAADSGAGAVSAGTAAGAAPMFLAGASAAVLRPSVRAAVGPLPVREQRSAAFAAFRARAAGSQ